MSMLRNIPGGNTGPAVTQSLPKLSFFFNVHFVQVTFFNWSINWRSYTHSHTISGYHQDREGANTSAFCRGTLPRSHYQSPTFYHHLGIPSLSGDIDYPISLTLGSNINGWEVSCVRILRWRASENVLKVICAYLQTGDLRLSFDTIQRSNGE